MVSFSLYARHNDGELHRTFLSEILGLVSQLAETVYEALVVIEPIDRVLGGNLGLSLTA